MSQETENSRRRFFARLGVISSSCLAVGLQMNLAEARKPQPVFEGSVNLSALPTRASRRLALNSFYGKTLSVIGIITTLGFTVHSLPESQSEVPER